MNADAPRSTSSSKSESKKRSMSKSKFDSADSSGKRDADEHFGNNHPLSESGLKADDLLSALSGGLMMATYDIDGRITAANDEFLSNLNYAAEELIGRSHDVLMDPDSKDETSDRRFWMEMRMGRSVRGVFRRLSGDNRPRWLQSTYVPVVTTRREVDCVILYCEDITESYLEQLDYRAKAQAIQRSQLTIEFDIDGTILSANDNFLAAMGYSAGEIIGKHHSIFVDPETVASAEYKDFWATLRAGQFQIAEYRRFGKGGREVWIQGSYTPVLDPSGKVSKIIKYAIDITERVHLQEAATRQRETTSQLTEEVIACSTEFSEGARVIAESSANLSDGASSQAASVEEITSAIDGLTQSIQTVTQSTSEAERQAVDTSRMATEGGQAVSDALSSMQLIEKSSEQISNIIQVISEIASQTNLLALNAAIEAARAGEHGLGFAVVADEVRKLAERSSEAAKEITTLISESSRRVAEGSSLSARAGDTLRTIVEAVDGTAAAITAISEQTNSQFENASEVLAGIKVISDTTDANAAASEELAASAEELTAQARTLQNLVAKYDL